MTTKRKSRKKMPPEKRRRRYRQKSAHSPHHHHVQAKKKTSNCLVSYLQEEVEPFPEERENFLQQLYKFMEDRGEHRVLRRLDFINALMLVIAVAEDIFSACPSVAFYACRNTKNLQNWYLGLD